MMQLYWSPRSRSFTALWLMEEAGQPYERVLTDISTGAQRTPEYLAINPMGKVPATPCAPNISTGCSSRRAASSPPWCRSQPKSR
jgi:Glutathione S-transferase, N-terminal domain